MNLENTKDKVIPSGGTIAANTLIASGSWIPSSNRPSQIRLGTLLIGPPKSIQPSAPMMKPYRTFALLSRPVMKFVKASVAQTIGVPITKYISNPPRIADKVGMIIIGIKASAQ